MKKVKYSSNFISLIIGTLGDGLFANRDILRKRKPGNSSSVTRSKDRSSFKGHILAIFSFSSLPSTKISLALKKRNIMLTNYLVLRSKIKNNESPNLQIHLKYY